MTWRSPKSGTVVHFKGYGLIRVFKIVASDGDIDYWATNDLQMSPLQRQQWAELEWSIEKYHRGLNRAVRLKKPKCAARSAQPNVIALAI